MTSRFFSKKAAQKQSSGLLMILRIIRTHAKRHPFQAWTTGLLTAFVTALWVIEPVYSSHAVDQLLTLKTGGQVSLLWIFGIWGTIFVLTSLSQALEHYAMWDFGNLLVIERRNEVYRHVLDLDIAFHADQRSGEVMKIVDEAADMLWDLQRIIFQDLVPSFVAGILFLIIGFAIAPLLSLILILTLVMYSIVVLRGVKKTWPRQHAANKLWVSGMGRAFDAVLNQRLPALPDDCMRHICLRIS
jgi:ABC-type multidrug transport system fused ATPase/permease subunit